MEFDLASDSIFGELKDWGGRIVDPAQIKDTRNGFLERTVTVITQMLLKSHISEFNSLRKTFQ